MGDLSNGFAQRRIQAIDAARGTAMLFVFLSHFVEAYLLPHDIPVARVFAIRMMATPAFITISGLTLGILFLTRGGRFQQTKWRFIWRGLFLLTFGRVLIFLAHIPHAGGWNEAARWAFVTDAIGFCILLGPWAVEHVHRHLRVALGIGIYAVSWIVILLWEPGGTCARILKEFLFGPFLTDVRFFTDVFPLLPWFGLFLVATVIGERFGGLVVAGDKKKLAQTALTAGALFTGVSVALLGGRLLLERGLGLAHYGTHVFLSPLQKLPPGPVYYLLFAGLTFLLLWLLSRFDDFRIIKWYSSIVEVIGRTSLFVFIVQYFVYFTAVALIDLNVTSHWPLYFLVSVALIWTVAYIWEQGKQRRLLAKAGR